MTRWTSTGTTWWWCLGCGLLVEATVPGKCARCSCESFSSQAMVHGTPASQAYLDRQREEREREWLARRVGQMGLGL